MSYFEHSARRLISFGYAAYSAPVSRWPLTIFSSIRSKRVQAPPRAISTTANTSRPTSAIAHSSFIFMSPSGVFPLCSHAADVAKVGKTKPVPKPAALLFHGLLLWLTLLAHGVQPQ